MRAILIILADFITTSIVVFERLRSAMTNAKLTLACFLVNVFVTVNDELAFLTHAISRRSDYVLVVIHQQLCLRHTLILDVL